MGGSLHVLRKDNAHADAVVVSRGATVYEMPGEELKKLFSENPGLSLAAIQSLSLGVRALTNHLRTPLLEQRAKVPEDPLMGLLATSAGAFVESYYRAGLNSLINYRLLGKEGMGKSLFPNMQVQIPVRIVYINGIKQIRQELEPFAAATDNTAALFGLACVPGIVMTPLSSLLEASNVSQHREPLLRRWRYGLVPRAVREVIFAIGFNQLSDYFEERIPESVSDGRYRSALGSMEAGCIAGFLSHHPHNMSTMKLVHPSRSYREIAREILGSSIEARVPKFPPGTPRWILSMAAVFLPQGMLLRSLQIAGTFLIVNGVAEVFSKDRQ